MSRTELAEELAFLARSLDDLEAERAAGDVSEPDYERLRERYLRRQDEVTRELGELVPAPPATEEGAPSKRGSRSRARRLVPRSRRARLLTGWGAFSCFALAALFLAMALGGLGPFAPTPSLSVSDRVQILLAEASVLGSNGKIPQAISTYSKALALEPHQPQALADGGWLLRLAGLSEKKPALVRTGDADIEAAVRFDPGDALARAYDGVLLYTDRHEAGQAVGQFGAMLSDRPSAALLWSVRPTALAAYKAAGKHVPEPLARARAPSRAGG